MLWARLRLFLARAVRQSLKWTLRKAQNVFMHKNINCIISNSNWTEWSTIQGVIGRALGRFEITSTITPWIVRHEVQLLINRNYNKIREEYDSGLNYLTGLYIQLLSYMPKKKIHSSATSASLMTRTVQLLRHDVYNCPITQAWRVQLSNYGWNQACWWPIRFENFDIVVINSLNNIDIILSHFSFSKATESSPTCISIPSLHLIHPYASIRLWSMLMMQANCLNEIAWLWLIYTVRLNN